MSRRKRLRKQPKMRRMAATGTATMPRIVVPTTAKKRKTRNRRRYRMPSLAVLKMVLSARWISLGLLALCVWSLMLIQQDETFYLHSIPVEGAKTIQATEIAAASGLAGTHVFAVDPSESAKRIGDLPGIVWATVELEWPNEIHVQVREDSPIAIWEQAGQRYWINEDGDLFPERLGTEGLLVVKSESAEPLGEDAFLPPEVLEGALQLRELRPNIDQLYYQLGSGLSYQDGRGWRAHFGTGHNMAQKLAVYETIVEDLVSRAVSPAYISVSNEVKPFYGTGGE
jgi:hypothetical protein